MWNLSAPALPATALEEPTGAPIAITDPGFSMVPLASVDFMAAYSQRGIDPGFNPVVATLPAPTSTSNPVTLSVAALALVRIERISHNGQSYGPAYQQPPTPGQFYWNKSAQTVTIGLSRPLIPGLPIQFFGGTDQGSLPTDFVDPALFQLFWNLPVLGEITWNLRVEGHPSGAIRLLCNRDTIAEVRERFKKGTELTFCGLGFYVSNYKEKLLNTRQNPGLDYEISLSLGGKWERRKYNRPAFLNPAAAKRFLTTYGQPYKDPECSILESGPTAPTTRAYKTSVFELAAQTGVPFTGFSAPIPQTDDGITILQGSISPKDQLLLARLSELRQRTKTQASLESWDVPIPKDAARDAATSWESAAKELIRINQCFIDYCNPDGVRARAIDDVASWAYDLAELEWTNKGDCEFSDGIFGYAVEFAASKLTGQFSETPFPSFIEDVLASPQIPPQIRWKRKDPNRHTYSSGDINAHICPDDIQTIKNMSLNADGSGRTTETLTIFSEDGVERRRERRVYGLAYTSNDVATMGEINAPAAPFWRLVQFEVTETLIDDNTGYFLGSQTIGQKYCRFKQESDNLEALGLSATDPEYPLYKFRWVASITQERKLLAQFGSYYPDAQKEKPAFDVQKYCLPDGTSIARAIPDRNYATAMFELASLTYKNSFDHIRNPDSSPGSPLPDLTTGEECISLNEVQILPNPLIQVSYSLNPFEQPPQTNTQSRDRFIQRTYETSAQGPNFGEITTRRTFNENDGRPSPAQRRQPIYEKEQYELGPIDPNQWVDPFRQKYEWILCSPGFTPVQPSAGSVAFQNARYFAQALTAAQTDYKIRDVLESVEFSCSVPFNPALRPLDRLTQSAGGDTYQTRISSISQKVLIQGMVQGAPLVVAPDGTQLGAGIDREVPITCTKRPLPLPPIANNLNANVYGTTLGDLTIRTLQNRGNF